ncbi:MAG TPA: alpha/beta hydrolase [Candidatus Udaeobacter sp.]|nr:alpha/beta hydrolase [Candidatus Udaeobacter sp.]
MTASQHMIQANGLRFRTMVDGPAGGEAAILLHGFPEGAESWSRQVAALAKAGALAIAPDMRGYGMSDAPSAVEAYRIEHLVEDVAGIIRAFGREQAHVAGHDWGAIVAWCFAAAHPEMTKSLTVLSCGHPAALSEASRTDSDQQERSRYVGLFLIEGKAEAVLAEDDFGRLREMFRRGPNPDAVPRGAIDHFARSLARPGRLTAGLNYYRANLAPGSGWSAFTRVVSIGAPTVLLWGDQDPALGRLQAEGTAKHMTGEFKLEVLEGAGHWLQFERSADVSRALIESVSNK